MEYNACRELHHELVYRLKRELVFYRSLYVLVERQRDAAVRGAESELALSYGELDIIMGGLRESQFAVTHLRQKEPGLFEQAVRIPPVPELVEQASEVLAAAHRSVEAGAKAARRHYRRLQFELARLGREDQALKAYRPLAHPGRVLDGTTRGPDG